LSQKQLPQNRHLVRIAGYPTEHTCNGMGDYNYEVGTNQLWGRKQLSQPFRGQDLSPRASHITGKKCGLASPQHILRGDIVAATGADGDEARTRTATA